MLTAEKIKEVKKQLRNGIPRGEIKNDLRKEGFSEDYIEGIFVPHRPGMQGWYLIFDINFSAVGVYNLVGRKGLLFLLFAAALFAVYFIEMKRIKKPGS